MANLPVDIANQALDAAGIDFTLGDLEEGTRPAQVCLRAYGECLRQLLRGAPWDFARRESPLVLLADATGQTPDVGTVVPGSQFIYEYAYPIDCARIRYIPWCPFLNPGAPSDNIQPVNSSAPLMTGLGQPPYVGQRAMPARYLVTNDPNYPPAQGQIFWEVQGTSPQGRVVILTNVQNARCVYTYTALYPSVWDHLFRSALVAYLASEIALPLSKDKKFGRQIRDDNIKIAMKKIEQARIADGNEMWASSDIAVDWMQARNVGIAGGCNNGYGNLAGDMGCWGLGWGGTMSFANGSAF